MSIYNDFLREIYGSAGDFGTLLPLTLSMAKLNLIKIGPSFFWGGIFNIFAGFLWNIPMPVQPMKTIAAVAITESLNKGELVVGGIVTGGVVMVLGATGFITILNKYTPQIMICAMQFALGIKMIMSGINKIEEDNDILLTSLGGSILAFSYINDKTPSALLMFIIGLFFCNYSNVNIDKISNPIYKSYEDIEQDDWYNGVIKAALPQIPLTLLNSCLSVCSLATELFGEDQKATLKSVSTSVGFMNLVSVWFGGIPSCHGAGGLAGQYKFGARTGISIVILGLFKIAIALIFGDALTDIIETFPQCLLGMLLIGSGLELGSVGIKKANNELYSICFTISVGAILASDTWKGIVVGIIMYYLTNTKLIYDIFKTMITCYYPSNSNRNEDVERVFV